MSKSVIIIPSRLQAKRLPNKPLLKINNVPIIIHVMERAKESKVGEVIVTTPDKEIFNLVKKYSGKAILTSEDHFTGTDRVHEALQRFSDEKVDTVINLQGDMPNIDPANIKKLNDFLRKNNFEIGTLASSLKKEELQNKNVVKVNVEKQLKENNFEKAKDFFRVTDSNYTSENVYHHIGIYGFTRNALNKYVKLDRTKNEIDRQLEQMRAMDNDMEIKVALSKSFPLGVDTEEDFLLIKKSMEYKS